MTNLNKDQTIVDTRQHANTVTTKKYSLPSSSRVGGILLNENGEHFRQGPLSLYPLTVEEIADGMLHTPPMPKKNKKK